MPVAPGKESSHTELPQFVKYLDIFIKCETNYH